LGAQSGSFTEAEVIIASAHMGHMLKLTQQFAYFTEIFFAAPLTFQAARQDVFGSLSEMERQVLVGAGHDAELALWKLMSERLPRCQQEIAARGVRVVAQPPVDLLAAKPGRIPSVRMAARSLPTTVAP
jgi:TRAP-type C4-dicarboxylate transport system substrate-binding protein